VMNRQALADLLQRHQLMVQDHLRPDEELLR
jgi:hypothetical protein